MVKGSTGYYCKCGKEIVFKGYDMVAVNEEGEEMTEPDGGYRASSEEKRVKTRMYACEDYPKCIHSRLMTEFQLQEYGDEQNDQIDFDDSYE
jgi:hypothetical protein